MRNESRTLRWRRQLGLLSAVDTASTATAATTNKVAGVVVLEQQQQHQQQEWWTASRQSYQNLKEKYPYPLTAITSTTAESAVDTLQQQQPLSAFDLDPLTAILQEEEEKQVRLQEMELKYKRERARRKRAGGAGDSKMIIAEDEDYDEAAVTLQIIDKDLHRLHVPPAEYWQQLNMNGAGVVFLESLEERIALLRRVLFTFHCTHAEQPGYRQGMHEIASYVLYAMALDYCNDNHVHDETNNNNINYASNDDDQKRQNLEGDCYTLLEGLLQEIRIAYDVPAPGSMSKEKPLEGMSRRVLQLVLLHDATLGRHILSVQQSLPPQLYLTKWMRLLLSRELADPATQVLPLWDALLDAVEICRIHNRGRSDSFTNRSSNSNHGVSATTATAHATSSQGDANTSTSTSSMMFMSVLEAAAAARLLVWRRDILYSTDTIHTLMNLPVHSDIQSLIRLTRQVLALPGEDPVVLPPLGPPPQPATTTTMPTPLATDDSNNRMRSFSHGSLTTDPYQSASASSAAGRFSFSSAVRQGLEQAKTKTQSLGKKLYEEWEKTNQQMAEQQQQQQQQGVVSTAHSGAHYQQHRQHDRSTATATSSFEDPLFDSAVQYRPRPMDPYSSNVGVASLHQHLQQQQPQQHQEQLDPLQTYSTGHTPAIHHGTQSSLQQQQSVMTSTTSGGGLVTTLEGTGAALSTPASAAGMVASPRGSVAVTSPAPQSPATLSSPILSYQQRSQQLQQQLQQQVQQDGPLRQTAVPTSLAQQMEMPLAILQNFVMVLETKHREMQALALQNQHQHQQYQMDNPLSSTSTTNNKVVPPQVWEALADLESIRVQLSKFQPGPSFSNSHHQTH